jgi:uncharacterized membrane protein YcaP (DUF421 family)
MSMFDSLLRVIIAFFGLLLWSRIIGKKMISHMTFFDFVAGVTFGAIGGNIIFNKFVSLFVGIMDLAAFSILVLLSDYVSLKSFWGRRLLESKPELIIENGKIKLDTLKSIRLTVNDLLMLLRKKNIFYLDEVEMAYFETDGTVSILKKPLTMSVSRKDLDLQSKSRGLPQPCIIDGKIMSDNLGMIGKKAEWMIDYLEDRNIDIDNVLIAQIDQQENVFLSLKL